MTNEEKHNNRELLLTEKRHEELKTILKGIPSAINKNNDNAQVAKAIEGNTKEIGNFGKMLGELQIKVEAPNVKVETDLTEVSKSISELKGCQERIEKLLIEQNEYFKELCRPKDYDFEFTRDRWDKIQSPIKAKSKTPIYKN